MNKGNKHSGIFYGWWVIVACSLMTLLSSSARFSFTLFLPTLLKDLGWTRTELGFGLTMHMWIYAFSVLAGGFIVDKYGPKFIMMLGGFLILLGLVLTSYITTPFQFYVYYGVILAVGVSATLNVPNASTARKWFVKHAGLAVGIVMAGSTLGLALMAIIAPRLIHAIGWRTSWFYLGIIFGIIIILLSLIIIRKDPESMGLFPDGSPEAPKPSQIDVNTGEAVVWTIGEAVKTRSFWLILFANGIFAVPIMGILGHIAAWGFDIAKALNIPEQNAEKWIQTSIFLMCICSVAGKLFGGPLSDKIGRKSILAGGSIICSLVLIYGVFINNMMGLVIFAIFIGFFSGMMVPLWAAYIGDIFGMTALATLYGFVIFAGGLLGGTGPVVFGWIFDRFGSYAGGLWLSAISFLFTFTLVLLTRKETK